IHRPVSVLGNRRKGAGCPAWCRCPPAPSSFWGRSIHIPVSWPESIRAKQLTACGWSHNGAEGAPEGIASARAVPARRPGATPDGRPRCKTAGRGCAGTARSAHSSRDDRSKKNRRGGLGADPRTPESDTRRRCPAPWEAFPGRGRLLPDDARHNDSDSAGSGPDVFPDPWESADTAGWLVVAAIAALRLGTRGYSIGLGGGSVERAARIP